MGARQIELSPRLRMLARLVTTGNRVADVGCDHGYLSIYLVQTGQSPHVIALDVREGPLKAAREHIAQWDLGAYIETRQSDGLCGLNVGEAETVVCAGMGGPLTERILAQGSEKARLLRELILQPQSEIPGVRRFLRGAGFRITDEDMVYDSGKYYFAMRAIPDGVHMEESAKDMRRYDEFGEKLLLAGHPVLEKYLRWRMAFFGKLEEDLSYSGTEKALKRLEEVRRELDDIRWALKFYDGKGR